ncbi:DUF2867 domain-containing protein [Pedobacter sp. HMF7647]|uniref:DUF2867 domain-containing protein n=1 Tax=Hufsiella arboris TaxID=2695275 RepID=A0A7K1YEE4_9SPHI|nr:SDR family oxidoreductase [Hufsiella arboris]MXV52952.1 DUF2867 domain-containing protein [Hufsiella arboris]
MRILLTGANGYIGARLLPILLEKGHDIICMVRDKRRFREISDFGDRVTIISGDLLKEETLINIPHEIDAAFYLVHSMSSGNESFEKLESLSAQHFADAIKKTTCRQIIYLTGIVNDQRLSKHLTSRLHVEDILKESGVPTTILRAAIIIGSGSASFEIIRDLTEKLPVMIAPKWLKTKCQPIAIRDVLAYMEQSLLNQKTFNRTFDIGGPDVLTYKNMLLTYARVRKLKRFIVTLPVLTPKLSSYWINMVTSVPYSLAKSLVQSMRNEVVCKNDQIKEIIPRSCLGYEESLKLAFEKIEQNSIVSSWKDALNQGYLETDFMDHVKVPQNGTLEYKIVMPFERSSDEVFENIWNIGGTRGWYYLDWLWNLRGFIDKLIGGIGTRRGRTSNVQLRAGDALDFWRVLLADRKNQRLLLYAEMKVPGEAWLELKIINKDQRNCLYQTATFRPYGVWGRMYWYSMWPFHAVLFKGMAKEITRYNPKALISKLNT